MRLLVTGGAGFIGSNFCHYLAGERPDWRVTVLDKLTYAGRRENLEELESGKGLRFIQGDICRPEDVAGAMEDCDAVVNFAAETHVDRSIQDSADFVRTDMEGVRVLLEEFGNHGGGTFLQVSTDEVYGSVEKGRSGEDDLLRPTSPYSASKAGGELLAMSYWHTHRTPVVVARSSNNYGPRQYPEKLIPLFLTNAMDGQRLPLYGDGMNRRDWLYVEDNCRALLLLLEEGRPGRVYNVGAGQELTNLEVTEAILEAVGAPRDLVSFVDDRPGHDRRYALDVSRVSEELGWRPEVGFQEGLRRTAQWYMENREWWEEIKSGRFREYYQRMYSDRLRRAEQREEKEL
ncbi:dTDP-glucose 4,6-dehydratase [Candidatus Fermentibacteria bacterium]|nr:dTDP-glucose 4,6-dehydratase [Candidatus Fermentibacteria bacterium]